MSENRACPFTDAAKVKPPVFFVHGRGDAVDALDSCSADALRRADLETAGSRK